MSNGQTIFLGRNPTLLESLGQGFQLGLPGLVQGGQNRALQQFAQERGLGTIPPNLPPQVLAALLAKPGEAGQFTLPPGGHRFSATGELIASVPSLPPTGGAGFTLTPGGSRFDAFGNLITSLPPLPQAPPVPRAPTTFEQQQRLINELSAIPKADRTPTQQARLDQLLGRKPKAGPLQTAKEGDGSGLTPGTVFQVGPQGTINIISRPGVDDLTIGEKKKLAVTQAKEFRADPRIQNLQIVERSERGMQAALRLSTAPGAKSKIASDQALGVLFQKMLDPTSVVRESEFARTPEGAALMSRITSQIPKLLQGGLAISDDDRRALVTMAQKLLNEAKVTANRAFAEFATRADTLGLDRRIVFGGRKPFAIGLSANEEARFQQLLRKQEQ